jgi:hypothetical protein
LEAIQLKARSIYRDDRRRPIAAKAMGVDRRQTGLQHVTHAPATPWDWKSAIVGGMIIAVSRLKLP